MAKTEKESPHDAKIFILFVSDKMLQMAKGTGLEEELMGVRMKTSTKIEEIFSLFLQSLVCFIIMFPRPSHH